MDGDEDHVSILWVGLEELCFRGIVRYLHKSLIVKAYQTGIDLDDWFHLFFDVVHIAQ